MLPPPKRLLRPLELPEDRLLCGPGPSNADPRVLRACSRPVLGHLHPEVLELMSDITSGLQYLFQTSNSLTLAVSGTGHAGMEAAFVNLVESGDRVLVLQNGIWGMRAKDVAERCGGVATMITCPPDQVFSLDEVDKALLTHKPVVLYVCHGESSTGTCQPLQGMGDVCHRHGCLLLVDAVASLGGVPFFMDEWGVDVAYSGSQKVIGAPPGTAPISFSPRARAKMASRQTKVQSFYFDMQWLAQYWGIDGQKRIYHHTGPVSSFYALREGLAVIAEEGLENTWKRHREAAKLLWKKVKEMGLQLMVVSEAIRLPTVTTVRVRPGVDWKKFTSYIMKKYNIEVSGGLGPTVGVVWRVGLMGYNSCNEVVLKVAAAMEDGLRHCSLRSHI